MAEITTLTITLGGADEAVTSFASLSLALLELAGSVGERLGGNAAKLIEAGLDSGDLFLVEPTGLAATGAGVLQPLQILPSDRYCRLMSAVAVDIDGDVALSPHGWPILSVGASNTPTVAGSGGATNPSAEGRVTL